MTTDGLFEFDIVPSDYVAEEDGETGTDTGTDTGTGDPEGDSPPPPPVNSPPQVNGVIEGQLTGQNTPYSLVIPATFFIDPDGDALTYSATLSDGSALPDWLTFSPDTLTFSGRGPTDGHHDYTIFLNASDQSGSATLAFDLTVSERPFVIGTLPNLVVEEDSFFSVTIPATGLFNDPDSILTFGGSVGSDVNSWLSFDPATMTFSGQMPQDFSNWFNLTVFATDGPNRAQIIFRVDVNDTPDAPLDLSLHTTWVNEFSDIGTPVGELFLDDPDKGDTHVYSLVDDAGGAFAVVGDQLVVNSALDIRAGTQRTVVVQVEDSTGFTFQKSIDITIKAAHDTIIFSDAPPATTILWVSTTGDDAAGTGSADSPFATIQHAIDNAGPGTDIMVRAGTYNEALNLSVEGTTDAPIRLISADGAGAAVIAPPAVAETSAISGRGTANWVIDGFTVQGSDTIGTYGVNLVSRNFGANAAFQEGYAGDKVENILLINNVFTDWGIDAIHIAQSFGIQIVNNSIIGAHEQGIDFVGTSKLLIQGNVIDEITSKDEWEALDGRDYTGDSAITVKGGSTFVEIRNNVIGSTEGPAIKIGSPTGIAYLPIEVGADGDGAHFVNYEVKHAVVSGNIATDYPTSLLLQGAQDVLVTDNLFNTANISSVARGVTASLYGVAEQYIPRGLTGFSDDISFADNIFKGKALFTNAPGATTYDLGGNAAFDPLATYDPEQYGFVGGVDGGIAVARDQIIGKSGDDVLYGDRSGHATADYISGQRGADMMYGGLGDDIYVFDDRNDQAIEAAGGGHDAVILTRNASVYKVGTSSIEDVYTLRDQDTSISGSAGRNRLYGNIGNDKLRGGAGDDDLFGGAGNDELDGGADHDRLYGGVGDDRLTGEAGDDILDGGAGRDVMRGGDGKDLLISYDADGLIDGGHNIDTIYLDRSTATADIFVDISYTSSFNANNSPILELFDGTRLVNIETLQIASGSGSDMLRGGAYADQISGGDGNDVIEGMDGDDLIYGGNGDDIIQGGNGVDKIDGSRGFDWIDAGAGDDIVTSNDPDLMLIGGAGKDTLALNRSQFSDAQIVDLSLQEQAGVIVTLADGTQITGFETFNYSAGSGDDIITLGAGSDRLTGGKGFDILSGGNGNDVISGGADDDIIYGGGGRDKISGDGGADTLYGGLGEDTFQFKVGHVQGDIIADFEGAGVATGDRLEFSGYGPGATLTYNNATQLWTIATADNSIQNSFQILNVTALSSADYIIL